MGLFSQAARTYDLIMNEIGQKNSNAEGLAPLFHKAVKIDIIVQINLDGELKNIDADVKDESGFIPLTEASSQGRSGIKAPPHALIDKVKYLLGEEYLKNLKDWSESNFCNVTVKSILKAIYRYVEKDCLKEDLHRYKIDKLDKIVGWRVELREENIETWRSRELQDSFIAYMLHKQEQSEVMFCMITGKSESYKPKVRELCTIGKLVSSFDTDNFSYLGRFCEAKEALSLGYITTQKAINVLEWLLTDNNYCISIGRDCRILCWRPNGLKVQKPDSVFTFDEEEPDFYFPKYKENLEAYIRAKVNEISFEKRGVVTVILNATSKGRGSIKFYSERNLDDFLKAMAAWDLDCCWIRKEGIKSPKLENLSRYSFGIFKNDKGFDADDKNKVLWNFYAMLIERRINNGRIPVEIINNLVLRCGKLHVYIGTKADKDYNIVQNLLFITCAALRKYYIDKDEKEFDMSLNKDSTDRSYQWGRLLAVFEKIELDALAGGKIDDNKKVTNATRMQSMFIRRPAYTASILSEKMRTAYYSRFSGDKANRLVWYEKLIGEIMEKLSDVPEGETDKPLKPTYLFGYYLQKNDFYHKKGEEKNI